MIIMCKKTVSLILAILMVLGCVSATAETIKQEKVYVVAGADGTVTSLTDNVRLENADGLETIADRTLLTGIENLSGNETFTLEDGALTWQANGKDIIYQGTSDKLPAVMPVVTITLDGKTVSAADLKETEGEAVLTVTFQAHENVPALALTAMLLPENGVSGLKTENASVIAEMGKQMLVGYAVPCADATLNLPASFSASFHADHADLGWMMTVVSSDPIHLASETIDEKINTDLHAELDEAAAILSAMSRNETLPETDKKAKDLVQKLNELNDGLTKLDNGAMQLADGTKTLYGSEKDEAAGTEASGAVALSDGAAALDSGLATLIQNNEALNNGAAAVFAAILDTANKQIAASGLDAAGIDLPALTAENYETALDAVLAQLDPETLKAGAYAQVEAVVRPKVEAQEAQIRSGVEEAVKSKVLEAVLAQVKPDLTVEQYEAARKAGKMTADQAAQISAAVDAQMASKEVAAKVEAAVSEKKEELIRENAEKYLSTDESVQAKLKEAGSAADSLKALKAQLDQISTFVNGVKAYTDGAAQAAAGAEKLNTGMLELKSGAFLLAQGADTLYTNGTQLLMKSILDAEANLARALLPYVQNTLPEALRILETTRDTTKSAHYDLAPEGIRTTTLYLIRTDL